MEHILLKRITGTISHVVSAINCLFIGLFIARVYFKHGSVSSSDLVFEDFESIVPHVVVISLVFLLAHLSGRYSRSIGEPFDTWHRLAGIGFAWVYQCAAAALFGYVAGWCVLNGGYEPYEYFLSIAIVALISLMGYATARRSGHKSAAFFPVPYMLLLIAQVILWIIRIVDNATLELDWVFAGNVGLFILAGGFVLFYVTRGGDARPAGGDAL
ncbi:MAG: hypothetical protein JXA20_03380 [Spirochaetes bacterium]|nr:hypothetical protein [Spirochaetota bacterium]